MINENHPLLLELWSRIKSHVSPKERLEVADIFINVFDEFGLVDDTLLDEDLDTEMRAAAKTHLVDDVVDDLDGDDYHDDSDSF